MAWMAMLGPDSVDYYRHNVVARGDEHPGQALAYYASVTSHRGAAWSPADRWSAPNGHRQSAARVSGSASCSA